MSQDTCPPGVREAFSRIQVSAALRRKAEENLARWLTEPIYDDSRPQLEYLIEAGNFNALFDAFFQEIPFGTGGRRGPVGYGTNRINSFTISTSSEGHSEFLRRRFAGLSKISVVVAYDVRVFGDLRGVYDRGRPNPLLGITSRDFARIAASVYAANGVRVWMPDPRENRFLSTPELSFAIRFLGAQGGLNVSASHNHPDDNGAKIYTDKGSQEIPPVDEELAKIVEATREARSIDFDEACSRGLIRWLPSEVTEAYLEANTAVSRNPSARSARVVFTPLHGTGLSSTGQALIRSGFQVEVYPAQAEPDGAFPTVPFRSPNPEVRESLYAAMEYARERRADMVLGTDPDADRLGMMVPVNGDWIFLDGNDIGVILTHYLCTQGKRPGGRPFGTTTMVTTSLFGRIARAHGLRVVDDLGVGFKYIADILNEIEIRGRCRDIEARPEDFLVAMEESHGYLVIPSVRDKDAAGAAVLLAEIASLLKERGRTFVDYLDDIYREFGCVRNILVSTVMTGARGFTSIRKIQDGLRSRPPALIGNHKVIGIADRWDESGPLGSIRSGTDRMSRDMITFWLEGGARLTVRPSGTESKNKVYVEAAGEPLGNDASREALAAEKRRLHGLALEIARAFTKEMLRHIDVTLPDYALEISDLVALESKQDFAEKLLPELVERLRKGERGPALEAWVDSRLRPYGADGRLLVAAAVRAYRNSTRLPEEVSQWLAAAFPAQGEKAYDPRKAGA